MSALPLCATCESAPASFQYVWGSDKPQVCCAGCLPGLVDGADRYRRSFSAHPLPLIAAAPELLEALKGFRHGQDQFGCWCGVATNDPNYQGRHSPQCKAAAAAIAKAQGALSTVEKSQPEGSQKPTEAKP